MSTIHADILSRFEPARVTAGGERYFTLIDAARIIDTADREGLAVLGIDIFDWDGEDVLPIEWHDFSPQGKVSDWPRFRESTNQLVRELLAQVPNPESKLATVVLVSQMDLD